MSVMRIRLPELLDDRHVSAYRLVKDSGGRVSLTSIYRLIARRGHVRYMDARLLDTLCDVLGVEPDELLSRDEPPAVRERKRRQREKDRAA